MAIQNVHTAKVVAREVERIFSAARNLYDNPEVFKDELFDYFWSIAEDAEAEYYTNDNPFGGFDVESEIAEAANQYMEMLRKEYPTEMC